MESGQIKDADITYSSMLDSFHDDGRMNVPGDQGAWVPAANDTNPWLLVDLRSETLISGVATQGRHNSPKQYVTSFTLSYSYSGETFISYNSSQVRMNGR